jgi:hypothetical protein
MEFVVVAMQHPATNRMTAAFSIKCIISHHVWWKIYLLSYINLSNMDNVVFAGHILTVETYGVPKLNGKLENKATRWTESMNDDSPYAFAVRVFHHKMSASDSNKKHIAGSNEFSEIGNYRPLYVFIRLVCPVEQAQDCVTL